MNRYENIPIIKTDAGKRRFASSFLPTIPTSEQDIYIVTTSVERLDHLAKQFYDDENLWWAIALVNSIGKGTIYVPVETRLRIPPKNTIEELI